MMCYGVKKGSYPMNRVRPVWINSWIFFISFSIDFSFRAWEGIRKRIIDGLRWGCLGFFFRFCLKTILRFCCYGLSFILVSNLPYSEHLLYPLSFLRLFEFSGGIVMQFVSFLYCGFLL